jgi:hypothetical protein
VVTTTLLVSGCPRSGTTILTDILNTHAEISLSYEKNLMRRTFTRDASSSKTSAHITGDKHPFYFKYSYKRIRCRLKGVKIIHISRNPSLVVNSMVNRTIRAKTGLDSTWNFLVTICDSCDSWIGAWNWAIKQKDNSDFLHVRHEDVVHNPAAVFEKVATFLDVENNFDVNLVRKVNTETVFSEDEKMYLSNRLGSIISDWGKSQPDLEQKFSYIANNPFWVLRYKCRSIIFGIFKLYKQKK